MQVALRGITKRFGRVRALAGVDVQFRGGRVAVVTGPNGSGKSTLLAIVGTLAQPTTGEVLHGDLGRDLPRIRACLGWVGHESLCYADLTGRENVELTARLHGLDPEAAFRDAQERFDLGIFADRAVRTYSRGQRQRIALARALVHRPALLLLDEPSAGLDLDAVKTLCRVVREEAARGATVVVITHDAALAREVGDDAWQLDRGRLSGDSLTPAPTEQPSNPA